MLLPHLASLPFSLILLAVASLSLTASGVRARGSCVNTGDETEINRLLDYGGAGTKVALCPNALFRLKAPILFTDTQQSIFTQGHPTDNSRAMLIVEGVNHTVAIKGDCSRCRGVSVSSLIIDGNRPLLLRVPKGEALVAMGNADDQKVENCRLYEPRGWSALHFREGDWKSCKSAIVRNNVIGPCGEEWDPKYDGTDETNPIYGNPRSDGISLACMNSLVERNTVFDSTDGAIVIFGSRGSTVRDNAIFSRTRTVLGGINLVDYAPWEGDYTDVNVYRNHISANSAYLKVAINVGPAVWSDDTESIVSHGTVKENIISGTHLGYGVVVASCKNFTVVDNVIDEGTLFSGVMDEGCPVAPKNTAPTAWLINKGSSEGTFQPELVNGEVQHVICVEPVPGPGEDGLPRRFRDSPQAIADKAAAALKENPLSASGNIGAALDATLTESLVMYQASVLQAVDQLETRIHELTIEEEEKNAPQKPAQHRNLNKGDIKDRSEDKSPFGGALRDLSTRLANLESHRRELTKTFEGLRGDLSRFNGRFHDYEEKQSALLKDTLVSARKISSSPERATLPPPPSRPPAPARRPAAAAAVPPAAADDDDDDDDDEPAPSSGLPTSKMHLAVYFGLVQVGLFLLNWVWFRRRRGSLLWFGGGGRGGIGHARSASTSSHSGSGGGSADAGGDSHGGIRIGLPAALVGAVFGPRRSNSRNRTLSLGGAGRKKTMTY